MQPRRVNEQENFVPLKITTMFNDQEVAIGTAFHYLHKEKQYLVSNWHNATGREPKSNKPKSPTLALPNRFKLSLPQRFKDDGNVVQLGWGDHPLELYEDADHLKPKWLEHPVHGQKVDLIVLEVGGVEKTALQFANKVCDAKNVPRLRTGMDVFILGYPRGLTGGGKFPIWKRGSIATEPDIDVDDLPLMYVDTATREGMSGAPVFASENGTWWPEGKTGANDMVFGLGRRFLGVYSGRIGDDTFLAQLAMVWKERAIIEIIEGQKTGVSSFSLVQNV